MRKTGEENVESGDIRHSFLIISSTSGFCPDVTIRVTQEWVTHRAVAGDRGIKNPPVFNKLSYDISRLK
jgi:hypothetical protein